MVWAAKKLTFYAHMMAKATGVPHLWLQAYHTYGYRRTTPMAIGALRLWLRAKNRDDMTSDTYERTYYSYHWLLQLPRQESM